MHAITAISHGTPKTEMRLITTDSLHMNTSKPSKVPERQDRCPEPRIHRPEWIAGRVGDARVKGARAKLAGIFQRLLGCQREQINNPDDAKGEGQGQPV